MRVAVTGAFGYSGRYIAHRLLDAGHTVVTLTNSLKRENPFGGQVQTFPFNFDHPERLKESLRGIDVLINTYWVRFDHRLFTHSQAVANTKILFQAAKNAGVRRIIHVSITNPDIHSDLPYFSGKAELESALTSSGVSYCILRPTVLFGKEDEKGSVNGIVIFSWRRKARSWFRARLARPGARRGAWGQKSACAFGRGDMSPGPKAASCRRTPKVGAIPGDGQTSLRDWEPCSRWFRGLKPHGYRQAVAPRLGAGMTAERG